MMFFHKGTHGVERKILVEIKPILVTVDQASQNLIIMPAVHLLNRYNPIFRIIRENLIVVEIKLSPQEIYNKYYD